MIQSSWAMPSAAVRRTTVAVLLATLLLLSDFWFCIGPPWPDPRELIVLGTLPIPLLAFFLCLPWLAGSSTAQGGAENRLRRIQLLVLSALAVTAMSYVVTYSRVVYYLPDRWNRAVGGWTESEASRILREVNPGITVEGPNGLLAKNDNQMTKVFEPASVGRARALLLIFWYALAAEGSLVVAVALRRMQIQPTLAAAPHEPMPDAKRLPQLVRRVTSPALLVKSNHPTREHLKSYLLGRLDDAQAIQVEEHLDQGCEACGTLALELERGGLNDPLGGVLAEAAAAETETYRPNESAPVNPRCLLAGSRLGDDDRYRIVEFLGSGGFGQVYEGYDQRLARRVAIKVSSPHNAQARDSFVQEAQNLARLGKHEGIVQVYDFGETRDGRCYLVCELIDGTDLHSKLASLREEDERLTPVEAARLTLEVTEALDFAHAKGLVHRDIKPANILLDLKGRPLVVDFGLALRAEHYGQEAPYLAGTVTYMSPEQARRDSPFADRRSDIYSLGVVLFELLAGRPPFQGTQDEILARKRDERMPPPKLTQWASGLPTELERICGKALAHQRKKRYQSAAELAHDLRRYLGRAVTPPVTDRRTAPFKPFSQESCEAVSSAGNDQPDEPFVQRLPLPLAQIYRRAMNAKAPEDQHLGALCCWEAWLKLLAAVAIVDYARFPIHDEAMTECLRHLLRPSLNDWWEFVQRLAPLLAGQAGQPQSELQELLSGAERDDLSSAAKLDASLREVLDDPQPAAQGVQTGRLIDRVVRYRNRVLGAGGPQPPPGGSSGILAAELLSAFREVCMRVGCLCGQRLLYVAEVKQTGALWLVRRFDLEGGKAQQMPDLALSQETAELRPERKGLYLFDPQRAAEPLLPLHPFLLFSEESQEFLWFDGRGASNLNRYLCYTNGRTVEQAEAGGERRALLIRALGTEVGADLPVPAKPEDSGASGNPRRRLGEFELISELGSGGMGVVYRAWQPSLHRQVAVKRLLRTADKAEQRFSREIRALGRLDHPHLVKAFTSGRDGDTWFYAMELVEGAPLSVVIERLQQSATEAGRLDTDTWHRAVTTAWGEARRTERPLTGAKESFSFPDHGAVFQAPDSPRGQSQSPPDGLHNALRHDYVRQAVELVCQAAQAAHALHQVGVIHRDIKPGNIMVTADGRRAVLMDLGLAQLADELDGKLTHTRQFVGTLRYASPEQVLAADRLDARTDVYSLGATLWELLTLRPLLGATERTPTPELMKRVQFTQPERVRTYHSGIAPDLEAVVMKCLEKDPARRYVTAGELADDLGRWLAGEPVHVKPLTGAYALRKRISRHRRGITLAAGLLVLQVTLAFFYVRFFRGNTPPGNAVSDQAAPDPNGDAVEPPIPSVIVAGPEESDPAPTPPDKRQPGTSAGQQWSGNHVQMAFCWCPSGKFTMGTPKEDLGRGQDEGPVAVSLSRGFWLGAHEVTQSEWTRVMNSRPWPGDESVRIGADYPATYVSWQDAAEFCRKWSSQEHAAGTLPANWDFRLPSEAQWEYACRAGHTSRFGFGDEYARLGDYAWFTQNAKEVGEDYAHEVSRKRANDWGLCDMHGNVWEWCQDAYASTLPGGTDPEDTNDSPNRVLRGGAFYVAAAHCRAAHRFRFSQTGRGANFGFRVAAVQTTEDRRGDEKVEPQLRTEASHRRRRLPS